MLKIPTNVYCLLPLAYFCLVLGKGAPLLGLTAFQAINTWEAIEDDGAANMEDCRVNQWAINRQIEIQGIANRE